MILACSVFAADGSEVVEVAVDSERWQLAGGRVVEHLGRPALAGGATLTDVEFLNGSIEVDVAVTGATSYPGIDFRITPDGDGESIYLRPHRIARYGDGVQYTPKFNSVSCWQLYNGHGATAGLDIPAGEWLTLRLEVVGDRARVFVGDSERPILVVDDLKGDFSAGSVGVRGPADGSAFFSNFQYSLDPPEDFGVEPWRDSPPGVITDWQVSEPLSSEVADADELPSEEVLEAVTWSPVVVESSGLVNLSRDVPRSGPTPDSVFVRTTIRTDHAGPRPLDIGYSDHATVYLNGRPVFTGRSAYRERDASFLGILGPFDTIYLPLVEGDNELVVKVSEVFGGWGLLARWHDAIQLAPGVVERWKTPADLRIPESVTWDPKRKVFYVSNYDGYNPSRTEPLQSIARISADGSEVEVDWLTGFFNPVGVAVDGDRLWVVERTGLVEVDLDEAGVVGRIEVPEVGMPNDVAVDGAGGVWVSDMRGNRIYQLTDGALEVWLEGAAIEKPNGIHVLNDELLIGVNGDQSVKAANLDTGAIRTVAKLGEGIIDGVQADGDGNIIVSHWEGRVVRIAPDGTVTKILDTSVVSEQTADIEYVPDLDLLVVPNFLGNRVTAYEVSP